MLRIQINRNHQGGCDCKVASVRVLGAPYRAATSEQNDDFLTLAESMKSFLKKFGALCAVDNNELNSDSLLSALKQNETVETLRVRLGTDPQALIAFNKLVVLAEVDEQENFRNLLRDNTKPSLVTALKLLDMIVDVKHGYLLFQSETGAALLDGFVGTLDLLQYAPPAMLRFIVALTAKIFSLSHGQFSMIHPQTLESLRACADRVVALAKGVTYEFSKRLTVSVSQAEIYHGMCRILKFYFDLILQKLLFPSCFVWLELLQSAVLCVNYLSIELVPAKVIEEKNESEEAVFTLSVESFHPFTDSSSELYHVNLPETASMSYIAFDKDTNIDCYYDMVRFFRDESKTAYWGQECYSHARTGLPGRGLPPLAIPTRDFYVEFICSKALDETEAKRLVPMTTPVSPDSPSPAE